MRAGGAVRPIRTHSLECVASAGRLLSGAGPALVDQRRLSGRRHPSEGCDTRFGAPPGSCSPSFGRNSGSACHSPVSSARLNERDASPRGAASRRIPRGETSAHPLARCYRSGFACPCSKTRRTPTNLPPQFEFHSAEGAGSVPTAQRVQSPDFPVPPGAKGGRGCLAPLRSPYCRKGPVSTGRSRLLAG